MSAPFTKLDKPLDKYALLCRGCLAGSGEMKNIFEWGLAEDFYLFTDIRLNKGDSISELLCCKCEEMMATCKTFRAQCRNVDTLLRETARKKIIKVSKDFIPIETEQPQENTISCVLYDKKLVAIIIAPDMVSKIYLSCPYCQESYIKQKDLLTHLNKSHNIKDDFSIELQYYCSVDTCHYYIKSTAKKFFNSRKNLNQHYVKVHMTKLHQCDGCSSNFATITELNRHIRTCNVTFICQICNLNYTSNEKLLVHLMRKHPDVHKQYKAEKKALKRKSKTDLESKKAKVDDKLDFMCESPKRSFATQTLKPEYNIKNDVTLPSWQTMPSKTFSYNTKTDEISTQTVFEDLLSLKSQTSEDESIFESVSLSDIQTQTFPLDFSNKETITSETQSPDLSIKETQTCYCLYDSPKVNYRLFDSISSSSSSINLASTETQTSEMRSNVKSDVLLSFNSAQTQTSFDEGRTKNSL